MDSPSQGKNHLLLREIGLNLKCQREDKLVRTEDDSSTTNRCTGKPTLVKSKYVYIMYKGYILCGCCYAVIQDFKLAME